MTHGEILERVLKVMPYPDQIKGFDFSEANAVRFTWRGDRFRAESNLMVEEVKAGVLSVSNIAIILQQLIKGGNQ